MNTKTRNLRNLRQKIKVQKTKFVNCSSCCCMVSCELCNFQTNTSPLWFIYLCFFLLLVDHSSMPLLTLLSRVPDGLMLSESMDSGKNEVSDMEFYRSQAKQIFKTLNRKSQNRLTLESGGYYFAYVHHFLLEIYTILQYYFFFSCVIDHLIVVPLS